MLDRKSEPLRINIDPCNPDPDQAALLHRFFLHHEQKEKHDLTKLKYFDINEPCEFEGKNIYFTRPVFRRKKMYTDFHVCDSPPDRDKREKNKLYIVHTADGGADIYSFDHDEKGHLTQKQIQKLMTLKNLFIANGNPIDHVRMSALMRECGYPFNRYIYQVVGEFVAEGTYGEFYRSPGKLEHSQGSMTYIDYAKDLHLRDNQMVHRLPKGVKVQKIERDSYAKRLREIRQEGRFWERLDKQSGAHSQTKKIVNLKYRLGSDFPIGNSLMMQRFFPGVTLQEMLSDSKSHPLTAEERYQLTIKLLKALKKFHQSGLVHRDLKPENIKIYKKKNNKFKVFILDLGMSKVENERAGMAGTPFFIPPEWIAGKMNRATKSHDFFAMGAVLQLLLKDQIFIPRFNRLMHEKNPDDEVEAFFAAKYYFNVPSVARISSILEKEFVDKGLSQNQLAHLKNVIEGMTQNRSNGRWSEENALNELLENEEKKGNVSEQKTDSVSHDDIENGLFAINKLSREPRIIFLKEWLAVKAKQSPGQWKHFYNDICSDKNAAQIRSSDIPALIRMLMKSPQDAKEKKDQQAELKMILRGSPLRRAWEKTFLPGKNAAERDAMSFSAYFLGYPQKNGSVAKAFYWLTLGPVMPFVKNSVKFSTEFLLKYLSELFDYVNYTIKQTDPATWKGSIARFVGIVPRALGALAEGARLLVRTVTSPMTSFKAAQRQGDPIESGLYATFSLTCSVLALVTLSVLALPIIPIVGLWVAVQVAPVLPFISPLVSTVMSIVLPAFLLNGIREWIIAPRSSEDKKEKVITPQHVHKTHEKKPSEEGSSSKKMIHRLDSQKRSEHSAHLSQELKKTEEVPIVTPMPKTILLTGSLSEKTVKQADGVPVQDKIFSKPYSK